MGGERDTRSGVANVSVQPGTTADRMVALQRSIGNRAATRLLARYRTPREKFKDAVGSSDWNTAAMVLSNFDEGQVAPILATLGVTDLRYLDDAINRHDWKGSGRLSAQVRKAMKAKGVTTDRTKAGRAYGKASGKYGKVKDGSAYSVEVDLYFQPDPALVGADEISWIQTVRTIDADTLLSNEPGKPDRARTTDKQYMVDRVVKRKYGWYGVDNDATAGNVDPWLRNAPNQAAHMWDEPSWNVKGMVWEFEAAAVCRKSSPGTGDPVGTVYAVVSWGFTVSETGKVKKHEIKLWNKPSPRQLEAVAKWNLQAQGKLAHKNHPRQKQLPDLL
jgi:hypothetical protein